MKLNKIILLFCTLVLATSGAQAGLILDILDDGAGFAEFTLSGSDTVASGFDVTNGVWLGDTHEPLLGNLFNNLPPSNAYPLTSGSGSITNTQFGTQAINDVFISGIVGCCDLGFRNGTGGSLVVGDNISWTGMFTTGIMFDAFNVGTYNFTTLGADNVGVPGATLTDGLTINVGSSTVVPEPTTVLLLGLGLAGLGFARRRRLNS